MRQLGDRLRDDSWGSLLKPAASHGSLCFAPSARQNVRFTAPRSWLGAFEPVPADDGLAERTRPYLAAYGTVMPEDCARWSAHTGAQAGRMIAARGDEAVEVDVEGTAGWMRREDAEGAKGMSRSPLRPGFSPPSTRGGSLAPPGAWTRTVRPACGSASTAGLGWTSPVVLVNGRITGVWRHELKADRRVVSIDTPDPLPRWTRRAAEQGAEAPAV